MTAQPLSSAARAGRAANNPLPEADADRHAEIRDGQIHIWRFGRFGPVTRWEAVSELSFLTGSPIPASQARAEAIRAALLETMQ